MNGASGILMVLQILALLLPVPLGTPDHDIACLTMEWLSFFSLTHRAFGGLAVAFFRYFVVVNCLHWLSDIVISSGQVARI